MKKPLTEEQKAKHREATRKWNAEHPDKVKEATRKWRDKNLDYDKERYSTPIGRAVRLLSGYNQMDRDRDLPQGDLTQEWIVENIFTKPCAHCGVSGWKIIGCNRLDNTKPHTKDNVEPCCPSCNYRLGAIERWERRKMGNS